MKTPTEIIREFEAASKDLEFGVVTLALHLKYGKPRYVIQREVSYLPAETGVKSEKHIGTPSKSSF